MTGQAMITAVAGRLGMSSAPTAYTNPTRVQILEWINTAKAEVAASFADDLHELDCTHFYFPLDPGTHFLSNVLIVNFVLQHNGVVLLPHEKATARDGVVHLYGSGSRTKHLWWFDSNSETTRTGANLYINVAPVYSGAGDKGKREYQYTRMPNDWTDAASTPAVCVPVRYIPAVIARASMYGFMADGRDELAVNLLGGQR